LAQVNLLQKLIANMGNNDPALASSETLAAQCRNSRETPQWPRQTIIANQFMPFPDNDFNSSGRSWSILTAR
jgi:hypothetical protein